jgi:eukaryotic-like serine/threonine-protein kinase
VLHRDVKPGNMMLGPYGETLVVDWGLAKAAGHRNGASGTDEVTLRPRSVSPSTPTLMGEVIGTPAYMSPEQACGELDRLGPPSDVYSMGATLYSLLTGRPPFDGEEVGELLRKVQHGDFLVPRLLGPSIDPALEAICIKAMALKAEDRYATCRALADDIEQSMADEPVTAWREPLPRRVRRWGRRNRTVVISVAASVLVALVGTAAVLAVQTNANVRLTNANNELALANKREKQRFDLAMEAIKLFGGEVGDDLVLNADQFKPLRDKLLRSAFDFYSKLEGLLKDQPDRGSRRAMGDAYFELGELTSKIGDKPAALAAHRKGLAVRQELASKPADDAEVRGDVARSLNAAAWLLDRTGNSTEVLVKDDPETTAYHYGLGESLLRSGQVRRYEGDPAGASADWRRADALLEGVGEPDPDYTFFHACCHASLSWAAGRPGSGVSASEADADAVKALTLLQHAAAMGYRDLATYRAETARDPLRDRTDFRLLMMELAFPAEPFAE